MLDTIQDMTQLEQVLLVVAVLTGLYQFMLLLSIAIRGGRVTPWWGAICAACFIAIILI